MSGSLQAKGPGKNESVESENIGFKGSWQLARAWKFPADQPIGIGTATGGTSSDGFFTWNYQPQTWTGTLTICAAETNATAKICY